MQSISMRTKVSVSRTSGAQVNFLDRIVPIGFNWYRIDDNTHRPQVLIDERGVCFRSVLLHPSGRAAWLSALLW